MNGIITVLGKDSVGIIAKVCTYLSSEGINISEISQTITGGMFHMMMVVDLSDSQERFDEISSGLKEVGASMNLDIRLQREDIFDSMHRI